ncbi:MAG: GntR family transcriptional regulator [Actinobacteria bacterium]|nr:GntR family transcriptional regulator [Actinomycetota bacterium]
MRRMDRAVLADRIREQILERILDGTLGPGARIVETRVAKEMGTSQAPVREALRDLAGIGLIEMEPYRGASVRLPSRAELLDALAVRGELEAMAGRLAAARCDGTLMAELRDLAAACVAGDAATDRERAQREAAFRALVVDVSRSRTLWRLWSMIDPLTRFAAAPSRERCGAVLEAVAARDGDAASAAMRAFSEDAVRTLEGGARR